MSSRPLPNFWKPADNTLHDQMSTEGPQNSISTLFKTPTDY